MLAHLHKHLGSRCAVGRPRTGEQSPPRLHVVRPRPPSSPLVSISTSPSSLVHAMPGDRIMPIYINFGRTTLLLSPSHSLFRPYLFSFKTITKKRHAFLPPSPPLPPTPHPPTVPLRAPGTEGFEIVRIVRTARLTFVIRYVN